jgi:hypothetical protein
MTAQIVNLVNDSGNTGKKVDLSELTVGANTVERQNICIADPATAANIINVTQFHNADNQALGTFFGILTGGVPQTLNVVGNLDRARGAGGDLFPGTGVPVNVSMTTQVFPPTVASGTVTAGANKTITIPSTANIKVGSVVQIETLTSTVVEWALVTAVVSNTSITVANLANGHTTPFPVYPVLYNQPRDAAGEGPLSVGVGASIAVNYVHDGLWNHPERCAFGLGTYTDTSATNATAGINVLLTTAGTPPTLASGQQFPLLIIDTAGSSQELCTVVATNPGGKTITIASMAANHNGSVTPLQLRAPIPSLNTAPNNFGAFGLAAEAAAVFSGLDTNGFAQFSVEKDVNAAGLAPVQGASSAAGMDADVDFAIFRTWANRFAVTTDKQLSPLVGDLAGNLQVAVQPNGTPVYGGTASTIAGATTTTLTIPAGKMGYLDGFDIDGLGATAASAIVVTVAGLLGGTLTYEVGIPAGVGVPLSYSKRFNPPLQCNAVNTNIVVTVPTFGAGNVAASTNVYGHYI